MILIRPKATWRAGLALCVGVLLRPSDAAAHLVTTGMGPVYDGIGHLLLTPEDLVALIAYLQRLGKDIKAAPQATNVVASIQPIR